MRAFAPFVPCIDKNQALAGRKVPTGEADRLAQPQFVEFRSCAVKEIPLAASPRRVVPAWHYAPVTLVVGRRRHGFSHHGVGVVVHGAGEALSESLQRVR